MVHDAYTSGQDDLPKLQSSHNVSAYALRLPSPLLLHFRSLLTWHLSRHQLALISYSSLL